MSIESSQEHSPSDLQKEIAALEDVRGQLTLVATSILKGMDGSLSAAKTREQESHDEKVAYSDGVIQEAAAAGRSLTEGERNVLGGLASTEVEEREFRASLEAQHPMDASGDRLISADDPLAVKLASLGVDMDVAMGRKESNGFPGTVSAAISDRLYELRSQIQEKKLLQPGGMEELTLTAIQATDALGASKITALSQDLHALSHDASAYPPESLYTRNIKPLFPNLSAFPESVRENVVKQMVQMAKVESGEAVDAEKISNELVSLMRAQG